MTVHPFIEAEKQAGHSVKRACELMKVSRTAFYARRSALPGPRAVRDAELTEQIVEVHAQSRGTYGAPRVHAVLKREGTGCGRRRVARLMRAAGLQGRHRRRRHVTTIPDPTAAFRPDLIVRDFRPDRTGLDARWCGDITYVPTEEGWLYLATVIDIASRRVGAKMWVLGTRALNFYYAGEYAASDAAAAQGIALSPQSPQAIRLWVNGRARALARQGDARGTVRAIGRALDLSDQQQHLPDGVTSCISFEAYSPARTLANAVTAHLSTGDVAKVLEYARQIEELVEQSPSQWTRSLVSLDVATAMLGQDPPDLEQALALGIQALHASGSVPIHSVWQRATELLQHAGKWHAEPVVRDY